MLQLTKSHEMEWVPLDEPGVSGLSIKPLRVDEKSGRPITFLLKFEARSTYPKHSHPHGEEIFVMEGQINFDGNQLKSGDYLYTPPEAIHGVFSPTGGIALFNVPEEVVKLE